MTALTVKAGTTAASLLPLGPLPCAQSVVNSAPECVTYLMRTTGGVPQEAGGMTSGGTIADKHIEIKIYLPI